MDINNAVGEIQSLMRTNSRHLPFPLAITAQNIEYYCQEFVRTGFTSRYLLLKNLIDFVEIYAKFVSVVYLSECRAICASPGNQEMFLKIRQALVDSKQARRKISYSLGDWLAIAEMAAKTLGHFTDKMVFPELINLVIDDPGKKKSKRIDAFADVCNNIVSIRNKRLGHGYVNESEETDFDEDFEKTLACVGLLLKTANKYFEEYDLVIAFYLNHQNNVYSWKVHGIEISEFFSRGSAESCDKLIKLKKGELQLALSPFAYYTTGALSLEYYYLMDSILTSNRTVVEDIDYLGIGHLKSKHYRLKSWLNEISRGSHKM